VLNRTAAILALAALFAFRVFYGLTMPFWFDDGRQVYLVGLQSFVRGEWPYFAADVVWTGAQLATREVVVKQILQPGESRIWSG
jgi:hypothetical protein